MNRLAMITVREGGDEVPPDEQVWCLVTPYADGDQTFCTSEYFGEGESDAVFLTKSVRKGGVTCGKCIDHIKAIKAVRL